MNLKGYIQYILVVAATALATGCGDRTPTIEIERDRVAAMKENMINANRVVIQSESTQIEAYVQRRGWKPEPLKCGACYQLRNKGEGEAIEPDDTVAVTYRLESLDGTAIYRHQKDTLVVGRREVTVALDDMLEKMNYGGEAWLIAPSNTAYGVVGDGDRVQSRTVIVYDIQKIEKIKRHKNK